jgi:hypothetical protein
VTEPVDRSSLDVQHPASEMLAADERADGELELTNEFATVRVRRVYTRNGVRLEIRSPRLGRAIRLDPLALESLTWQTMETFSRFLREPYGPPDD